MDNNNTPSGQEFEKLVNDIANVVTDGAKTAAKTFGENMGSTGKDIGKSLETAAKAIAESAEKINSNQSLWSQNQGVKVGKIKNFSASPKPIKPASGINSKSMIYGSVGFISTIIATAILLALIITVPTILLSAGMNIGVALVAIPLIVTSIPFAVMGRWGLKGLAMCGRYKKYIKYIGTGITMTELSAITKYTLKCVKKDFAQIQKSNMDSNVIVSSDGDMVFLDKQSYKNYEELLQARKGEAKMLNNEMSKDLIGTDFLTRIDTLLPLIHDKEIKEKTEQIRNSAIKIFTYVSKYPESADDTRKFYRYYMPTTLKLLETYTKVSESGVEGANAQKIKDDIDGVLLTLVGAYDTLLDELHSDMAMDVSADVKVLKSMLEQEGLTEENKM